MTLDLPARNRKPGKRVSRVLWLTLVKYSSIDGGQRAAAFAYYAFFALFPLLLLLVSIAAYFFDPAKVGKEVIDIVSRYMLVADEKHDLIRETIHGVIKARSGVGSFALLGLVWSSFRFFQSLVIGVNRAWGNREYSWWRLPLQNLLMVAILASAILFGVLTPWALRAAEKVVSQRMWAWIEPISYLFNIVRFLLAPAVLFYGFSMFYKLAPQRKTTFREVWPAALLVILLLKLLQYLFVLYAKNVAHFNAIYGAFGSVIALLMWVYLSGSVIILGGCFSAAQAEVTGEINDCSHPEV
jgi:Ca2+-transporting ATPase